MTDDWDVLSSLSPEERTDFEAWKARKRYLRSLKVGDHVLAGSGLRAELRIAYVDPETTPEAVVRWLPHREGDWLASSHHSRVGWHTIAPDTGQEETIP